MHLDPGALALLYAIAPIGPVCGTCRIDAVHRGSAGTMWRRFGSRTGLKKSEFIDYLAGSEATCIEVSQPKAIEPITLAFSPPQSWMHLHFDCREHRQLLELILDGRSSQGGTK